jgi:hypothetical protein
VGFVDDKARMHFIKALPESEMCAIVQRLRYRYEKWVCV